MEYSRVMSYVEDILCQSRLVSRIRAGRSRVHFRQGQEIFRLSRTPRSPLGSNQPPIYVGAKFISWF